MRWQIFAILPLKSCSGKNRNLYPSLLNQQPSCNFNDLVSSRGNVAVTMTEQSIAMDRARIKRKSVAQFINVDAYTFAKGIMEKPCKGSYQSKRDVRGKYLLILILHKLSKAILPCS
ncbi:MAG: hypothetical protein ACI9C4_002712 [Paraglaciecola sp.]|jgi:hypothetical protein